MLRNSKYNVEQKLTILNEVKHSSASKVARKYGISSRIITTWHRLYKYQGIDGLRSVHSNRSHSKQFKLSLVKQYQDSDDSLELFAIKHGLKSKTQLQKWILQYNGSQLKVYTLRKRDSLCQDVKLLLKSDYL